MLLCPRPKTGYKPGYKSGYRADRDVVRDQGQDRFLRSRDGRLFYYRRVPASLSGLDTRYPFVRQSLKTNDLAKARAARDILEQADNELWASMLAEGQPSAQAVAEYRAAQLRAKAMGFAYKPAQQVAKLPIEELVQRITAMTPNRATEAAVLGGVEEATLTVSKAFEVYCDEIVAGEVAGKSEAQRAAWRKVKQYAVNAFIKVVSDKQMGEITREDGIAFFQHYRKQIIPDKGSKTKRKSGSLGKRRIGDMRVLYDRYFRFIGQRDRVNPFADLTFSDKLNKRKRPPFPVEWVVDKFLTKPSLAGLNNEARDIFLTIIETGARPSELCNLMVDQIRLDADVPHILIAPRDDPDDPREIKTASSMRAVPLVGVALEAMKRHPKGFPRYKDAENTLSQTLNSYLDEHSLRPTARHVVYSLRHTFEDRMKDGHVDSELRKLLMGHSIDRQQYGEGGSLEWRRDALLSIALPFNRVIFQAAA